MAQAMEMETRRQSKTPLWFKYRARKVTAFLMKAVCHTDGTNPAQSLVKEFVIQRLLTLYPSRRTEVANMKDKPGKDTKKQLDPRIPTCR